MLNVCFFHVIVLARLLSSCHLGTVKRFPYDYIPRLTHKVSLGASDPGEAPDAEAAYRKARVNQAAQYVTHQWLHQGLAPWEALGQELREESHNRNSLGILLRCQRAVQARDNRRHMAWAMLADQPGKSHRNGALDSAQGNPIGKLILLKTIHFQIRTVHSGGYMN